jgi:hypothetical protein
VKGKEKQKHTDLKKCSRNKTKNQNPTILGKEKNADPPQK